MPHSYSRDELDDIYERQENDDDEEEEEEDDNPFEGCNWQIVASVITDLFIGLDSLYKGNI